MQTSPPSHLLIYKPHYQCCSSLKIRVGKNTCPEFVFIEKIGRCLNGLSLLASTKSHRHRPVKQGPVCPGLNENKNVVLVQNWNYKLQNESQNQCTNPRNFESHIKMKTKIKPIMMPKLCVLFLRFYYVKWAKVRQETTITSTSTEIGHIWPQYPDYMFIRGILF